MTKREVEIQRVLSKMEIVNILARHQVEHGDGGLRNWAEELYAYDAELQALLATEEPAGGGGAVERRRDRGPVGGDYAAPHDGGRLHMKTKMRNGWRFDGDDDLELTIFPEQDGPDVEVCAAIYVCGERFQDGFNLNETDMRRLAAWFLEMAERVGRFPVAVNASGPEED